MDSRAPRVVSRELHVAASPGFNVQGSSYYTAAVGPELIELHSYSSRSDLADVQVTRRSYDNGRSWAEQVEQPTMEERSEGMWRRHVTVCCHHAPSDSFVSIWTEGVLPSDDAMEGLNYNCIHYSVSKDGGRSALSQGPVIVQGEEFSARHPMPGVVVGRNSFLVAEQTCVPLVLGDGTILQPFQITPVDEHGNLYNPGGGLKYRDSAVLRGTLATAGHIDWEVSQRVQGNPAHSTRGVLEPTLAQLTDGRILMIMRGSNDTWPPKTDGTYAPAYKWYSLSRDEGRTWSEPQAWTDTQGRNFYSPSSCSQLVPHSSGRLFWIGNVTPENPVGNGPRDPLVIAEVDAASGLVMTDTWSVIDTRGESDAATLQLTCFHAREDRETGDIILNLPRLFSREPQPGRSHNYHSDLWQYRIDVPNKNRCP
jgi:hypothetical protein